MSDFKDFSKKVTQDQNDSNPKPTEEKTEKPIQTPEVDNPSSENNKKENQQ